LPSYYKWCRIYSHYILYYYVLAIVLQVFLIFQQILVGLSYKLNMEIKNEIFYKSIVLIFIPLFEDGTTLLFESSAQTLWAISLQFDTFYHYDGRKVSIICWFKGKGHTTCKLEKFCWQDIDFKILKLWTFTMMISLIKIRPHPQYLVVGV
jgi:uncharacterized membrane protein